MINVNDVVSINGEEMMIKDIPDQTTRAFFGFGHFPDDIERREIHQGIGMYDPETCLEADRTQGVWINFQQNLVCIGCGMDFT